MTFSFLEPLRASIARFDRRFLMFLVVGGLNTAFGYGLFNLLVHFKVELAQALLLSTMAGVLFNFKTTGNLVFSNRDNRLLLKFVAVYGVLYGVNLAMLKVLIGLGLATYLASAVLILPMAVLSFLLNRAFVFSEEK